jgi:tape measure domain-containing protein
MKQLGIRVKIDGSGAESGARKVNKSLDSIEKQSGSTGRSLKTLAVQALATYSVIGATRAIVDATNKMRGYEVALKTATGSTENAASSMAFVRSEAERLGLQTLTLAETYTQFAGAARKTNLEGEDTRQVFTSVSEAAAVMQLSAQDTQGAMNALTQMLSKGKVQAEELRGQLGERIPGAFRMAADAMGVTQAALNDMLDRGEVIADEFLPRFAEVLRRDMAGGLLDAANSAQASFNRFENAVLELKIAVGEGGLVDALAGAADMATAFINQVLLSGQIVDDTRVYFDLWAAVLFQTEDQLNGVKHALGETGDFLLILGEHAGQFVKSAFFEFPANIKAAIAIGIAEFGKLGNEIQFFFDKIDTASAIARENMIFAFKGYTLEGERLFARFVDMVVGDFQSLLARIANAVGKVPGLDGVAQSIRDSAAELSTFGNNEAQVTQQINAATEAHNRQLAAIDVLAQADAARYEAVKSASDQFIVDTLRERDAVLESAAAQSEALRIIRESNAANDDTGTTGTSSGGGDTGGGTSGGSKTLLGAFGSLQDQIATQQEQADILRGERLRLIDEAEAAGLEAIRPWHELRERVEDEHIERLNEINAEGQSEQYKLWQSGMQGKLKVTSSILGQVSKLMESESRTQFEIGKAAAISQAIINTYQSATGAYNAMAGIPYIGPALGAAAAAAAIAAGIANVNAIRSQSFGSAGSASGSSPSTGGASASGGANAPSTGGVPEGQGETPQEFSITIVNRREGERDEAIRVIRNIRELAEEGEPILLEAS